MPRYKLTIEYDGAPFCGWQLQQNRLSVQGALEQAAFALSGENVRVHGAGLRHWPSVASLGTRPTVNGVEPLLEAHLFDFDGDLYGRLLSVEFVAKLRDERHFASLDALVVQMADDAAAARDVLAAQNAKSGVTA